jgi:predicted ATP-grasp superfamily ATP-dependent carboligase
MTTVLVYEWACALGLGRDPSDPDHSLYREGRAMRDAVADDFRRVPEVEVVALPDAEEWRETDEPEFRAAAAAADYSLVIAPESGWALHDRCRWVNEAGGRLLGPDLEAVRLTGVKWALCNHWARVGVPTPVTVPFGVTWPPFPVVLKPDIGAGSYATHLARNAQDAKEAFYAFQAEGLHEDEVIVQAYVPGRPASVAFLVGPRETVSLQPTFQLLSADGRFRYEGGELPIRPDLAARAVALGRRAIDCVPGLLGYVGVDLILGEAADGSQDFAIEINPRLTTSYVGLRRLADFNLAEAMLRVATGGPVGELRWMPGRVRFRPDGSADSDPAPGGVFG